MAKNKVVYNGQTLIDLTDTTATASDVLAGTYFYNVSGERTAGTLSLLDAIYPIGSIYMSTQDVSPQTFLGGYWEKIKGRFLLAAAEEEDIGTEPDDSVCYRTGGTTGGSERVTLTANQSGQRALTITGGAHSHDLKYRNDLKCATGDASRRFGPYAYASSGSAYSPAGSSSETHTHYVSAQDASESHGNMPPYLAVHMWERVAAPTE